MIILGKGKGSKKNILDGKDHLELLRNNKYGSGCSSKNKYPPMFTLICEPILIQSAIKSWCSVFIPFRLYRRKDGSYSKPRLSLRKYQYMQNGNLGLEYEPSFLR